MDTKLTTTLIESGFFTPSGKEIIFKQDTGQCNHMPYIDMCKHKEAFAMIQTVCKNFEECTMKEVEKATYACQAQAILGHQTDKKFKQLVSTNAIKNCPVTIQDIANSTTLFGPNQTALRGKTVRQKIERVDTEFIPIPYDFYELHKFVTLNADVMFVNGVVFLTTLYR